MPGDDARRVEYLRMNDQEEWDRFYRANRDRYYSTAWRILRDQTEAEDAVAEAFARIFEKLHTYNGRAPLDAWARRVMYRVALDLLDKSKNRRARFQQENELTPHIPDARRGPDARSDDITVGGMIEKALASAADDFRVAWILRFIEDLSYVEIAELTGVPVGTARTRVHRCLLHLRAELPHLRDDVEGGR